MPGIYDDLVLDSRRLTVRPPARFRVTDVGLRCRAPTP